MAGDAKNAPALLHVVRNDGRRKERRVLVLKGDAQGAELAQLHRLTAAAAADAVTAAIQDQLDAGVRRGGGSRGWLRVQWGVR